MPDYTAFMSTVRYGRRRLRHATDLVIASLWVATCAVTPEFIWRGARVAIHHLNWSDLAAALLVGLVLAFCVEPTLERLRHAWIGRGQARTHGTAGAETDSGPNLLFSAGVGLAFAFASVCLHDSITTFLASHAETGAERHMGLVNGLRVAGAWTTVPFCIALAWLTRENRLWGWLAGMVAAASPTIAAWAFGWSWQDWVTTQIPAAIILALGYRFASTGPRSADLFRRAAKMLAAVALIWLFAAVLIDRIVHLFDTGWVGLYTRPEFWVDARFYFGWAVGLLLAPVPRGAPATSH